MAGSNTGFHEIAGQETASRMLAAAVTRDRASHAYLFIGPEGAGKLAAALELAAALCCEAGGCGRCGSCLKVRRGTHPDVEVISPVGAFITVEQIRQVNRSLYLFPGESRARVFIITDATAFNAESANAFLKTLEEPPGFVKFIIMADRGDRVLPTIVSRCQTIRFDPVRPAVIGERLEREFAVSATMAQTYAAISGGNLTLAESFCRDQDLRNRRERYIEIGMELARGEGEPQALATELLAMAEKVGDAAADGREEPPEGFAEAGARQRQQDAHRSATAARKRELDQALQVLQSWFRDMMVVASGAPEVITNRDYELELEQEALESRSGDYRRAAEAVNAARRKLGYNIDLELALLALFNQLQEVM
ncbi:MAG TPA: DNA polymerase III subunit delta' [Actinobacteria bacterium]|nr:DNA polymerase III subunit delta' [Actinomycetota bacterium]